MDATKITATGIVAEYNPFHNGHLFHIQETKKIISQPIIAVISGSIMQRGEPAAISKWLRAKLAVENGIDLVLELPAAFSLRSAEFFAQGAISMFQACGCVTNLSCGAESPDYDFLTLAQTIQSDKWQNALHQKITLGTSYATACAELLPQVKLTTPNDILALEYCKALLKTDIQPIFIHRRQANYNDDIITGNIASATAIRKSLLLKDNNWQQSVPENTKKVLSKINVGYNAELLWQLLAYRLRLLSSEQIAERCQCSEGLENLLKKAADAFSLEDAVKSCTNKRYSSSRIRRLFLQLLLDQPRNIIEQSAPSYLRVLAFNDTGRKLLKQMKNTATLPIITKLGNIQNLQQSLHFQEQINLEITATNLWSLLQYERNLNKSGNDYLISPEYIKI